MTFDKKPLGDSKEDADLAKQLQLRRGPTEGEGGRQLRLHFAEPAPAAPQVARALEDLGRPRLSRPWKTSASRGRPAGSSSASRGKGPNRSRSTRSARRSGPSPRSRTSTSACGRAGAGKKRSCGPRATSAARPAPGSDPTGHVRGETWIDVATGQAMMSRNTIDVDLGNSCWGRNAARRAGRSK